MATYAARRLGAMCFNTAAVVGIEAMAAAQGIEFTRPLRSSPLMEKIFSGIRERVAFLEKDRLLAPDIEQMRLWGCSDRWPAAIVNLLPSTSA
jgi:histidine ammonia-lyase